MNIVTSNTLLGATNSDRKFIIIASQNKGQKVNKNENMDVVPYRKNIVRIANESKDSFG